MIPRNLRRSEIVSGFGYEVIACTRSDGGWKPSAETRYPRKVSSSFPNSHYSMLVVKLFPRRILKMTLRLLDVLSGCLKLWVCRLSCKSRSRGREAGCPCTLKCLSCHFQAGRILSVCSTGDSLPPLVILQTSLVLGAAGLLRRCLTGVQYRKAAGSKFIKFSFISTSSYPLLFVLFSLAKIKLCSYSNPSMSV